MRLPLSWGAISLNFLMKRLPWCPGSAWIPLFAAPPLVWQKAEHWNESNESIWKDRRCELRYCLAQKWWICKTHSDFDKQEFETVNRFLDKLDEKIVNALTPMLQHGVKEGITMGFSPDVKLTNIFHCTGKSWLKPLSADRQGCIYCGYHRTKVRS